MDSHVRYFTTLLTSNSEGKRIHHTMLRLNRVTVTRASFFLFCNGLTSSRTGSLQKETRISTIIVPITSSYNGPNLLVEPGLLGRVPLDEVLVLEPQGNLLVGALDAVGAVADVAAHLQAQVAADGTGSRGEGVGGTEHGWTR